MGSPVYSTLDSKKHPSKNLQISRKIRSSHRKRSAKIAVLKSFTNLKFQIAFKTTILKKKQNWQIYAKFRIVCLKITFSQTFAEGGIFRPKSDT